MVHKIITSVDFIKDESTQEYLIGVGEAAVTLFVGYDTQEEFVKEFRISSPPKTGVTDSFTLVGMSLCAKAVVYTYKSKGTKAERDLNEFLNELLDNGWELLTDTDQSRSGLFEKGGGKDGTEGECPF